MQAPRHGVFSQEAELCIAMLRKATVAPGPPRGTSPSNRCPWHQQTRIPLKVCFQQLSSNQSVPSHPSVWGHWASETRIPFNHAALGQPSARREFQNAQGLVLHLAAVRFQQVLQWALYACSFPHPIINHEHYGSLKSGQLVLPALRRRAQRCHRSPWVSSLWRCFRSASALAEALSSLSM